MDQTDMLMTLLPAATDSVSLYLYFSFLLIACFLGLATAVTPRKRNKSRETKSFRKISSMINRSLDLNTILATALEEIIDSVGMDSGIIQLRNANGAASTNFTHGYGKETSKILEGISDEDIASYPLPFVSGEVSKWGDNILVETLRREDMKFFAIFPVLSGNQVLGNLKLSSQSAKPLSATQEEYISAFCEILGVAIVNTQIRDQSSKLSEDLVALQEVNKIISESFDLEDIILKIVVEGKRLAKTSQCHLFLLDDSEQNLVGSASTQTENFDIREVQIKFSEASTPVTALLEKRVIVLEDTSSEEGSNSKMMETLGWRSAIFAPLLTKQQAIGVLVCSDDISHRKFMRDEVLRAEALAHQAAIALESARLFRVVSRSRKEWETTFDAMQDCVSVHDTTGKVIRANVALARRFNTIPQKIIGRYCSQLYNEECSDQTACRHTLPPKSDALIVEEVDLPSMGGVFQLSVSPWYDKNNRLAGSIHVAKDISNEKLLQQQLIQSEKLSAIGELISGIAHELNNPLTGVMGYSQLLQLREDLDDRAKENLHKINNLALRCQRIVQNLLSFARKQKPERTLTDINEIIEKTIELRSYELQVNNIEIHRNLDRNLPKTIADAHQLQQVFLNIVTNAEQAMLESNGKGQLKIRTRTDSQNANIIVEIKDDGPGIPENHLNRIFDPFFTTKEVGKGTGLGLSLSYGMIKEHGGNIYVRSRLNEGSTFFVEIPIMVNLQDDIEPATETPERGLDFEKLVRNKRILVVDDEKYILDFFIEAFQAVPVSVDTVNNGQAALQKMENFQYDIVITDFRMPQVSGKELFNWIREHRPRMANRIIFVTGDTVSNETRSFFEENHSRFLAKPFKIEEVKEVIQRVLKSGK
jgi:two-component system NtrC family sensor kinase